jgi:hypothetical protein
MIKLKEVLGMNSINPATEFSSVNDQTFKVIEVINRSSFIIDLES